MNLDALKSAVAPLTKFGQEELTFTVPDEQGNEILVALRPLLPREETACQQYAAAILTQTQEEDGQGDDDPLTRAAALRYFDQFRTEIISYAIVQIGKTDLRQVSHIETGETLGNGVAVKVTRQMALRGIIEESWSRGMITITFSKYGDLITKIAEKADKVAKESMADLDAEVERLERRLKNVKADREKRAKGDPSVTAQQIQALVRAGQAMEDEMDQTIAEAKAAREVSEAIRMAAEVADEEIEELEEEVEEVEEVIEEPPPVQKTSQPRRSVIPPTAPPPTAAPAPPQFRSSFGDASDADSEAIELERLMVAEAAVAAAKEPSPEKMKAARAAATQASRALLEDEGSPVSRAEQQGYMIGPDGQIARGPDGQPIPTYKLPSETISPRKKEGPGGKTDINPKPKGVLNPNFKPSGN